MSSLKTWALLSVALSCIAPTLTEVVQSMTQCERFLLDNKLPQVPGVLENGQIQGKNRYKVICQMYNGVQRFVTLYDTKNKIPVLSAYKFTGAEKGRPVKEIWKMEPQLEDMTKDKNMKDCSITAEYQNQAGDNDYAAAIKYNKGHLFPSSYAKDQNDKISTFTLTNAVPQVISFNNGSWEKTETCVKCVLEKFCIDNNRVMTGYVMTGAQPGLSENLNNRVNVPSLLWSAFCCYSSPLKRWIAGARWGSNVKETSPDVLLPSKTLKQLSEKLSVGDKKFVAFPGRQCPLDETVEGLYPQLNQNCHCVKNPQG